MREPKRIEEILDKIEKLWKKYPDSRFGQLISNIILDEELYYLEDDRFLKKLEIFEKMLPLVNK